MDFDEPDEIDMTVVENAVQKEILAEFSSPELNMNSLNKHSNSLIDNCIKTFQRLGLPYKYSVTCIISQKVGAGCVTAAACYWDSAKDNLTHVKWENGELTVIVTVFAMAIDPHEPHKPPPFEEGEDEENE